MADDAVSPGPRRSTPEQQLCANCVRGNNAWMKAGFRNTAVSPGAEGEWDGKHLHGPAAETLWRRQAKEIKQLCERSSRGCRLMEATISDDNIPSFSGGKRHSLRTDTEIRTWIPFQMRITSVPEARSLAGIIPHGRN